MRGRRPFVTERARRGHRPEDNAGTQALFVRDQQIAVAVHVRHARLQGVDGVASARHEHHRGLSAPSLRGHRAVRPEGSGPETVRG